MQRPDSPLYCAKAYVPVVESFGFSSNLRFSNIRAGIFLNVCLYHWDMIPSDPSALGFTTGKLVASIRKRRRLKEKMTPLSDYEDKL